MSVIVIVIPFFLNKFGKIKSLFIFVTQNQLFFIIYYKRDNSYSVFAVFSQMFTSIRNRVTMATA